MEISHFSHIQADFKARVAAAVYCVMATVDGRNRPRTRIMHPVWDGPIGWVISSPSSHKARHLQRNPAVSLAYIQERTKPLYVDGIAQWVDAPAEQQRIWDLHRTTPPPLGFDPQPHYGGIDNPLFGLLRITPRRIELADLFGESRIWRNESVQPEGN